MAWPRTEDGRIAAAEALAGLALLVIALALAAAGVRFLTVPLAALPVFLWLRRVISGPTLRMRLGFGAGAILALGVVGWVAHLLERGGA